MAQIRITNVMSKRQPHFFFKNNLTFVIQMLKGHYSMPIHVL